MRVKRGFKARRYRKKILKRAKGFRGSNSRLYTEAIQRSDRALVFQYRDRRTFKNDIKKLWNHKISVASKSLGLNYSTFMGALRKSEVQLNRPQLAHLIQNNPFAFKALVEKLPLNNKH